MSRKIITRFVTLVLMLLLFVPTTLAAEKTEVRNLVAGKSYSISTPPKDIWEDTDNKELTDGIYGIKDHEDEAWQGHHIQDQADKKRVIEFDLEEPKSIKRISANYLHNVSKGIRYPTNTIIRVSGDGSEWFELDTVLSKTELTADTLETQPFFWDGQTDGIPGKDANVNSVFAQYVQLEFEIDSPWVFIDEIEVIGIDGKIDSAFDLINSEGVETVPNVDIGSVVNLSGFKNLSQGLDYTVSIPASADWPDTDGKELTNGASGNKNLYSPEWQGFSKAEGNSREIMIDFKEMKSIGYVSANFLRADGGIGFPANITVQVSESGEEGSWATLGKIQSKKEEGYKNDATQAFFWDGRTGYFSKENEETTMAYAQFLKVTVEHGATNWVFIDELKVFGFDEKVEQAEIIKPDSGKPVIELPEGADYMRAGELTGGANDIALIYNHEHLDWKADDFIPYLSYQDKNDSIRDRFFDSILYLGLRTPEGKKFDSSPSDLSNKADWEWYLNRTFKANGDMEQLDMASQKVATELGEPNKKTNVFLMIPYPSSLQSNFGEINGQDLNFNPKDVGDEKSLENRKAAVKWYIDKAMSEWRAGDYEHLNLIGLYWVAENVDSSIPYEFDVVKYASKLVHDQNLKHLWIPYFQAAGYDKWEELGFDMAILQPGYYFSKYAGEDRLEETSLLARKYGMGVEIELDESLLRDDQESLDKQERFIEYLAGAREFGFDGNVLRGYYQGAKTLKTLAESRNESERSLYEEVYKLVRDTEVLPEEDGNIGNKLSNLVKGLPYALSVEANEGYPDKDNKELTDGVYGTATLYHQAWQGHNTGDSKEPREVVFDLEDLKEIHKVNATFLSQIDSGVGFPSKLTVEVSENKEDWQEIGFTVDSFDEEGPTHPTIQEFTVESSEDDIPVGRYVKVTFDFGKRNWMFIDEIEVYGKEPKEDVELTKLIELINKAKTFSNEEDVYTIESFEALQQAIDQAEASLDTIKTEEELEEALTALQGAIDGLVKQEPPIKLDQLVNLINTAKLISNEKNEYTAKSYETLQAAIKVAETSLETIKTEEELEEALTALQEAIDGLVKTPEKPSKINTSSLEELIKKAKSISNKKETYTKSSFEALQQAIDHAEASLETIKTEEELEEALTALQEAIDGLVKAEKQTGADDESGKENGSEEKGEGSTLPKTATTIFTILLFGGILTLAGLLFFYLHQRRVN